MVVSRLPVPPPTSTSVCDTGERVRRGHRGRLGAMKRDHHFVELRRDLRCVGQVIEEGLPECLLHRRFARLHGMQRLAKCGPPERSHQRPNERATVSRCVRSQGSPKRRQSETTVSCLHEESKACRVSEQTKRRMGVHPGRQRNLVGRPRAVLEKVGNPQLCQGVHRLRDDVPYRHLHDLGVRSRCNGVGRVRRRWRASVGHKNLPWSASRRVRVGIVSSANKWDSLVRRAIGCRLGPFVLAIECAAPVQRS